MTIILPSKWLCKIISKIVEKKDKKQKKEKKQ